MKNLNLNKNQILNRKDLRLILGGGNLLELTSAGSGRCPDDAPVECKCPGSKVINCKESEPDCAHTCKP